MARDFKAARDFLLAHRTDYASAYAQFRWPELGAFNWALDWFDAELARGELRDRPALRIIGNGSATLTFGELSVRSNRVANGLRALGVKRGDRILLMLGNVAPLWEVTLAAMKLGAVVVPATTLLTADDLNERVGRARVRFTVAASEDAGKLAALPQGVTRITVGGAPAGCVDYATLLLGEAGFVPDGRTDPDDPMLLYFTSGTTARPKLVLHSHRSYPVGHLSTMYWLGLLPGDVHLNVSSPGWAKHAWSCFFAPWNAGATVFIANQPRFNAGGLLDAIAQNGVTTLCAPPTVWRMFIQEDLKTWKTALREVTGAGEPLNPEVIDQVRAAWGLTIRDGYGQTETTAQIGNPPGQAVKPGSMGRPLPGYTIRLIDTDDKDADEGAVCIPLDPRPAGLMRGYQNDDGSIAAIGGAVYRTGDVAARDADGYLTYVGRGDDIFKASDYRISPFELESVLIEHPAVAEAAVVPAPDPLRLAVPKAYVALTADAEPSAATALSIFAHLRARLSPYKRVRRIEFAELPKTISGKIRRVELRRAEAARSGRAEGEYREDDFPELTEQG
ncbi:AMP-binding protein [Limobrevibacterium gyesilva]|uniref:AMP-binding protein n=1 Tax=Limobrevibacterium gyesilva TaxID=2991712 RepID=A0AA41YRR1_9PROT|nr:AMP-binding protein [Limobrevibacterium gyesilva]MCW3477118.1 AMP-binding protein [Limobrevibacterium gyesilva]